MKIWQKLAYPMFAALLLSAQPSLAVPIPAPTPLVVGGIFMNCGPVPVYFDTDLDDFGYAHSTPVGSFIRLNPVRLSTVVPIVQSFIFAHECGHLVTMGNERDADCWAIQNGKAQGWFGPANFPYLIQSMQHSPGDSTHLPGPARIAHIEACWNAV